MLNIITLFYEVNMPLGEKQLSYIKNQLQANQYNVDKTKSIVMKAIDVHTIFQELNSNENISRERVNEVLETQFFDILNQLDLKIDNEDKQALITNITDKIQTRQFSILDDFVNQLFDFIDKVLGTSLLEKGSKADISTSLKEEIVAKGFADKEQQKNANSQTMDHRHF